MKTVGGGWMLYHTARCSVWGCSEWDCYAPKAARNSGLSKQAGWKQPAVKMAAAGGRSCSETLRRHQHRFAETSYLIHPLAVREGFLFVLEKRPHRTWARSFFFSFKTHKSPLYSCFPFLQVPFAGEAGTCERDWSLLPWTPPLFGCDELFVQMPELFHRLQGEARLTGSNCGNSELHETNLAHGAARYCASLSLLDWSLGGKSGH